MAFKKQELESLIRRDPLAWAITHVDLLEDKKWEVSTRRWIVDIYAAVNPWEVERNPVGTARRLSIIKSTQAGISTMAISKALHFATNWNVRIGYTLPRQMDLLDFVATRLDPLIESSKYLRGLRGTPDSTHSKRLGNSYLFFMEMSVESRMMPIDSLYVDEVDLSNEDNISTAQNRMDASRWKLSTFLSTPTVANFGIDAIYKSSDMREWMVKCTKCNHEQPLDWEVNLRVMGNRSDPTRVYYGCEKCDEELTLAQIQSGRWVAQEPKRSYDHIGFHISQMMTTSAPDLYKVFLDPQTKMLEFYRKRLGKPYEVGGGSIERDDFLVTCFDDRYDFESEWDGQSTYFMGVDQGNELQVLVCKKEKDKDRPKVVHVELVPMSKGFDRIAQLMDVYKIRRAVVDGNPNRHAALSLQKKFPGRVLIADYVEQKQTWSAHKADGSQYLARVTINRTSGFDDLIESIKKGQWQLPGSPPNLHPDVELVIDHTTALKRDTETRKTAAGEVDVAVWRKIRADHLAHAWLYMKLAIDITKGKTHKIAVIGRDPAVEDEEREDGAPTKEDHVGIVALLAEVKKEQLEEFLKRHEDDDYNRPFPLSYKMRLAEETYNGEDILWVINWMLRQG